MKSTMRILIEKALKAKGIECYAAYNKNYGTYVILTLRNYDNLQYICTQVLKTIYDNDKSMKQTALLQTPYNFIPPVVVDVSCFGTRIELYEDTVWERKKNQNQQLSNK